MTFDKLEECGHSFIIKIVIYIYVETDLEKSIISYSGMEYTFLLKQNHYSIINRRFINLIKFIDFINGYKSIYMKIR